LVINVMVYTVLSLTNYEKAFTLPLINVPVTGVIVVDMVLIGLYTPNVKCRLVKVKLNGLDEGGVMIVNEPNIFIVEPLLVKSLPDRPPSVMEVFVMLERDALPTKVIPTVAG
jgi:hypothetical protein